MTHVHGMIRRRRSPITFAKTVALLPRTNHENHMVAHQGSAYENQILQV